jgi:hypothetical protein
LSSWKKAVRRKARGVLYLFYKVDNEVDNGGEKRKGSAKKSICMIMSR